MENLTGGTPPVRYLPCVVPCKLYFPIAQEKRDNIDAHKLLWYLIKELVKLTRAMESGGRTSLRMRDVICLLRSRSGLIHLCGTWLAEVTFVNGMAP